MKDIHENSVNALAEQQARGKTDSFRKQIHTLLKTRGEPMTDRQVMACLHESDFNNVRPEITRLKQDGLVVEVGKVTCDWTGKKVRRCVVTGKEYFERSQWYRKVKTLGQMTFL